MLSNQKTVHTKLVIGEGGANSQVRMQLGIPLIKRPYRHYVLIATIKTEYPHRVCAGQVFYAEKIIAFLPLWQPYLSCLVWSAHPKQTQSLLTNSNRDFERQLSAITQYKMGQCKVISKRQCFLLLARYARHFMYQRAILIGDAAHTIHPLAGQGVNVGFQYAQQFMDKINLLVQENKDFSDKNHLIYTANYRQRRALIMLSAMQGIQDLFTGDFFAKKGIRGVRMRAVNRFSSIGKHMITQAMGL